MELSEPTTTLPSTANEDLTPLEQDLLDEYERLAENMKKVNAPVSGASKSRIASEELEANGLDVACKSPRHDGRQTDGGDLGWATAAGTQDKLGVYVVEGECV